MQTSRNGRRKLLFIATPPLTAEYQDKTKMEARIHFAYFADREI